LFKELLTKKSEKMLKQLLSAWKFFYTSYVKTKREGKYVVNMTEKKPFGPKKAPTELHYQKNFTFLIFF
jgi:hypothetical protein